MQPQRSPTSAASPSRVAWWLEPHLPLIHGMAWFAVSATFVLVFALQIHSLLFYRVSAMGDGLRVEASAFGLVLSGTAAALGLSLALGRPWVRRIGAVFALLDLLFSLFFSVLPISDPFRNAMYLRMVLDGVLVWTATYEGAPLHLPRVNRDLVVALSVIVAATAGLSHVFLPNVVILQYLINGLVVGSIYVLGATGLSLIFGIRKFANFAHGEMMTFGAYMALWVNVGLQADIVWAVAFAIVATAGLAILLESVVFRKLAGKGPVSLLVASIGVTIFLNNLINASFGTNIQTYDVRVATSWVLFEVESQPVLTINPLKGVATLAAAIVLILFLHVMLSRTTLGKAMRATADNPDLARASGINTRNVILWTWAIAGAMVAVAGALLGIVNDVRPGMGFNILLFVFAAVIVGGLGSPYGAMLGGFMVGIAQELSVALLSWLGRPGVLGLEQPVAYKPVAAFFIMIVVLLVRPEGLVSGRRTTARRGWVRRARQIMLGGRP